MKVTRRTVSKTEKPIPDLSRRPPGMHLEKFVEVTGFSKLKLRPIRPDDETRMIEFHRYISPKSICLRYFGYMSLDRRTSHERLVQVCTNTADTYSIVMEQPAHRGTNVKILAVGRLTRTPEPSVAMFDVLIGDEAHIPKLAKILLHRLISLGRAFRFEILTGQVLRIDHEALKLCRSLDFTAQELTTEGIVQVLLKL